MKKNYQTVTIDVLLFSAEDVVTVSDNAEKDIFDDWE